MSALAETVRTRGRQATLLAGAVLASAGLGLALTYQPWFAAAAVLGAALVVVTLLEPVVMVGLMLAVGVIDLSYLSGGYKALLPETGGLDMNGIRLMGIVAALTAILLVDREAVKHALGRYGRWYAVFLLVITASLAHTPDLIGGLRFLLKLALPYLVFVVVLTVGKTPALLDRLMDWTLAGGAFIVFLLAPTLVALGEYTRYEQGRLTIFLIGNYQDPMSDYLLAVVLMSFARFTVRGQVRYLLLCGGAAIWMGVTVTRITMLAAGASLLAFALYGGLASRNWRTLVAALVVAIAVVAPAVPFVLKRTFGYVPGPGELFPLFVHPAQLYRALSLEGRELIWPVVLSGFLAHPIFGQGLGGSSALIMANFPHSWGTVAHNEYLRVAADTGAVGLLLFGFAIVRWWGGTIEAGRVPDRRVREFAMPAFAIIVAWGVISLTDNALDYYAPFTQYVGFLCGAALAAAAQSRAGADQGQVAPPAEALVG